MRQLEPNSFDFHLILKRTSISILRIKISEASKGREKSSFKYYTTQIYLNEKLFMVTLIFTKHILRLTYSLTGIISSYKK